MARFSKTKYINDYYKFSKRELCNRYKISYYKYCELQKELGLEPKLKRYKEITLVSDDEDEEENIKKIVVKNKNLVIYL